MFECARCGSSYSSRHVGVEHCPRCRLRDKVDAPLAFKAFDLSPDRPQPPVAHDAPGVEVERLQPSSARRRSRWRRSAGSATSSSARP